jgi:hypothetical protein
MANITIVADNTSAGVNYDNGPLSSLEKTSALLSLITRYPSDLGTPNKTGKNNKNHWVTFTIYDIEPAKLGEKLNKGATTEIAVPNAGKAFGVLTSAEFVKNLATSSSPIVDTLKDATINAALTKLLGGEGLTVSPPISDVRSYISLYMPDTLTASYSANYEEMSLTSDLGTLITTLRAIGSSSVDNLVSSIEGLGNNTSTDPNVIQAISSGLQTLGLDIPGLDVGNLGTLLQRASGYALNPQLQMVYRGTGLRTFELSFTFTPKSAVESSAVNNIIQQFRYYSSPALGQQTGGAGDVVNSTTESMFLIPPSIFKIQFYVNGEESTYLPKYGNCILENLSVNHAPNGFSAFTDGSMVQTQLSLSFKEMDILTRNNIKDTSSAQRR